jgi:hypothetical protein
MKGAQPLLAAIHVLRAPVIAVCTFVAFVAIPGQSLEIYRAASESPSDSVWIIVASFLSVVLLGVGTSYFCKRLIAARAVEGTVAGGLCTIRLAVILPLVPAIGLAGALAVTAWGSQRPPMVGHQLSLYATAAAVLLVTARIARHQWRRSDADRLEVGAECLLDSPRTIILLMALVLATTLAVITAPRLIASLLGPVATFALFSSFLLGFLAVFDRVYLRTGIPVVTCLALAAALWSWLEWNENHRIRTVNTDAKLGPVMTAHEAFGQWLALRADLGEFVERQRPYPVYVVSAEGGGIYAAVHAAATLSRLQDGCPRFAQHLFAVSGVSGGSVGSALFAAAASQGAKNEEGLPCEDLSRKDGLFQFLTEKFFDNDFLTPVILGALFPDFLQLFLPFPVYPFDRARLLESSLEEAWARAMPSGPNPWQASFRSLWRPEGATPALVLNTTLTTSGGREFIAPFKLEPPTARQSGNFVGAKIDLPLSTAIGVSARFPWVTPAAIIGEGEGKLQVADGGYFENSGIETAHDLIRALQGSHNGPAAHILTVEINGRPVTVAFRLLTIRGEGIPPFKTYSGEVLAPIRTLLAARENRGIVSFWNAIGSMCPTCSDQDMKIDDTVRTQTLWFSVEPLPLGWFIGPSNRKRIWANIGDNRRCGFRSSQATVPRYPSKYGPINDCLYEYIYRDLALSPSGGSS